MFTRILPSPFRKRIRKRQRKGFRHITEKQNFVHKEMSSKSFLRQQRQQWQREKRAQQKMSRGDIQQGQQNYCCQLVFSQAQGTISSTCQLNKNQLLNFSTRQLFASDQLELYEKGFYRSFVFASQDFATIHVFPITKTYRHLDYSDLP